MHTHTCCETKRLLSGHMHVSACVSESLWCIYVQGAKAATQNRADIESESESESEGTCATLTALHRTAPHRHIFIQFPLQFASQYPLSRGTLRTAERGNKRNALRLRNVPLWCACIRSPQKYLVAHNFRSFQGHTEFATLKSTCFCLHATAVVVLNH